MLHMQSKSALYAEYAERYGCILFCEIGNVSTDSHLLTVFLFCFFLVGSLVAASYAYIIVHARITF